MTAEPQGKTQLNMGFNFCALKPTAVTMTILKAFRTSYESQYKGEERFPPTN